MAFLKYANAIVANSSIYNEEWQEVKSSSNSSDLFTKTASANLNDYPPSQYLLTHATIIASVDVEEVPNVKTGEVTEGGQVINRKWNDYYITPETEKFINCNGDGWDRDTLLATYKTFRGASNFVEHIQIASLEKGKIVDAIARDLGDTVYVDILVATNRKHTELIKDIESGKINTLSMGCSIQYSRCSKCGNVAADETELCDHIKYSKGNYFHDHTGKKRVVAEICGHSSDLDSVTFIEASWVANPAFKGAVLRDILNGDRELSKEERKALVEKQSDLLAASPMLAEFLESQNMDRFLRNASIPNPLESLKNEMKTVLATVANPESTPSKTAFGGGGFGDDEEEEAKDDSPAIDKVKEELKDKLRNDVSKELLKELQEDMGLTKKEPMFQGPPEGASTNENIVQAYQAFASRYSSELKDAERLRKTFSVLYTAKTNHWSQVASGEFSNRDIVAAMYLRDRDFTNKTSLLEPELYLCLEKVGGATNYKNVNIFLNACSLALGRRPSQSESEVLIKRSKFLK